MNQRIRQLAEQCRGNPMTSEFEPRFDKEKFAELIIREAARVAGRDVGHFVLEHFEVAND